ncbi:hypothetical protein ACFX12_010609 [Malus domestica]
MSVTIEPHGPVSLPSLRTLPLKSVCINRYSSFLSLIFPSGGCLSPALENLSIVSCSAAADTGDFYVLRMTDVGLRSLEVIDWHCHAITAIAKTLESVTIVSDSAKFMSLGLYGCPKVKYMNVRARRLPSFNVYRFSQSVKEARFDASKRMVCSFDNEVCDRSTFLSRITVKLDA